MEEYANKLKLMYQKGIIPSDSDRDAIIDGFYQRIMVKESKKQNE